MQICSSSVETADRLPVVLLMGPTASGKTDLAVALRERLPFEIVSVDSAMVYRGMDIGTAKPDPDLLARAPHRLIDILDPREPYSAARFRSDALNEIRAIHAAGRIPLLVGGTMLYFRLLQQGLSLLPEADPAVRARLEADAAAEGAAALHARLARVDPDSAMRIHPNDPQRLQRALEVYEVTGVPLSELFASRVAEPFPFRAVEIVVAPSDRDLLRERIGRRFERMLAEGFVAEVEALYRRGDLDVGLPSIRCVGYRQAWGYLQGEYDLSVMIDRAVSATRQLAKRQLTWLRQWPQARRLDTLDINLVDRAVKFLDSNSIN